MTDNPGPQIGPPIKTPHDLFHEYARLDSQLESRLKQIESLQKANEAAEPELMRIERWIDAVFKANPEVPSVMISFGGTSHVVQSDHCFVARTVPASSSTLTMVPEPPPEVDDDSEDAEQADPTAGLEIAARF